MKPVYELAIIPEKDCKNRGVYVMDSYGGKFDAVVAVYDRESRHFLGLDAHDMIVMSCHVDTESGFARPVIQLPVTCTVDSLQPYTVYNDQLEGTDTRNSNRVTIANYSLYVFLDEYEVAYASGLFT